MIKKPLFAVLWIGVVALLAATPVSAVDETFQVTGRISKVPDRNVTAVTIQVPEEGDFPISNEGKGKELLAHVGATVEITGTFNDGDNLSINVISYKIKEPK